MEQWMLLVPLGIIMSLVIVIVRMYRAKGNDKHRYRISVKALVLNKTRDKFLVVLEESGKWDLLGGGLKHGETEEECLRREIKEEMGVDVVSVKAHPCYFLTGQYINRPRRGQWYANVVYEVELASLDFKRSNECEDLLFISIEDLPRLVTFDAVEKLAYKFKKENHAA